MNGDACIFCKIIARELPAKVIFENNNVMVIQDIAPKAPVHYLIFPKTHIKDLQSLNFDMENLIPGLMLFTAQELSKNLSGNKAFRLIFNNGADAGQSVFHLHAHFLSGKKMLDF